MHNPKVNLADLRRIIVDESDHLFTIHRIKLHFLIHLASRSFQIHVAIGGEEALVRRLDVTPDTDGSHRDETGFARLFSAYIAEDRIPITQHDVRYELLMTFVAFSQIPIHEKVVWRIQ